ncbi:MAG: flagellar biosynthetic protein FliR [Actinomycetota bacterium]|nr:flagellar biosynthetic protein FliR [Actinomycetota bacterium]
MTIALAGDALTAYLLAAVRIIAWLVVVPPFSSKVVPNTAKVVLAMGLAFGVTSATAAPAVPQTAPALIVAVVTQTVIGAALGFVTYLMLTAVAAAGTMIDLFGGFSLPQAFDPLGLNMNTVFGKFHQMLATALLFVTNAHLLVIGGLLRTFHFLPVGQAPSLPRTADVLSTGLSLMFISAVQIALPMIAVLFIADLGLALLTKVAPQLNAINVMFPAKIGLVLLILGLSFPVLPTAVERLSNLANQAMATLVGAG